jgi:glutamate--cysteine ligase
MPEAPRLTAQFEDRISRLINGGVAPSLAGGLKGVEKESLRVRPDGMLSEEPHPRLLGSALTNRFITTDFSEALLEFVTPAFCNTWETLRFLCDIHQFTHERLDQELLWPASMPCRIPDEPEIPLARYGSSNVGRMKTIYRRGLGYRYGRSMQTIAGIHFNYSVPEVFWPAWQVQERQSGELSAFRSASYLGLVRNFRRFGWLVLYLFGASPALCKSFAANAPVDMRQFDAHTLYEPFGTSLRMSDLGYNNRTQAKINISLNSLGEYIADLVAAITTPEPAFEKIGVKVGGEYRQLSANRLQIENEYYSPIRPKRTAFSGERPTAALLRGGIEYVEIRSLDINVCDPVGINQNVMRFMEAFLIYCLMEESAPMDDAEWDEIALNHSRTARNGRDPSVKLLRSGKEVSLRSWGQEIADGVRAVAELIDGAGSATDYVQAVDAQRVKLTDAAATPSARLLADLEASRRGFFEFVMEAARGHREYFRSLAPMNADRQVELEEEARNSAKRQREIESRDHMSFDRYLESYFAGT